MLDSCGELMVVGLMKEFFIIYNRILKTSHVARREMKGASFVSDYPVCLQPLLELMLV